jgi:hypothetical protein
MNRSHSKAQVLEIHQLFSATAPLCGGNFLYMENLAVDPVLKTCYHTHNLRKDTHFEEDTDVPFN